MNDSNIMKKYLQITMSDGSAWGVPIKMIAENRAKHYAYEFGNDLQRSLGEDTLSLFDKSKYAIYDWATGNMDWSDFDGHQVKILDAPPLDFQSEWMSGKFSIVNYQEVIK